MAEPSQYSPPILVTKGSESDLDRRRLNHVHVNTQPETGRTDRVRSSNLTANDGGIKLMAELPRRVEASAAFGPYSQPRYRGLRLVPAQFRLEFGEP